MRGCACFKFQVDVLFDPYARMHVSHTHTYQMGIVTVSFSAGWEEIGVDAEGLPVTNATAPLGSLDVDPSYNK